MQLTYGLQHSMVISLQVMNLLASVSIVQQIKSLGMAAQGFGKTLAAVFDLSHRVLARSKLTQKLIVQIFVVFTLACREL